MTEENQAYRAEDAPEVKDIDTVTGLARKTLPTDQEFAEEHRY